MFTNSGAVIKKFIYKKVDFNLIMLYIKKTYTNILEVRFK